MARRRPPEPPAEVDVSSAPDWLLAPARTREGIPGHRAAVAAWQRAHGVSWTFLERSAERRRRAEAHWTAHPQDRIHHAAAATV